MEGDQWIVKRGGLGCHVLSAHLLHLQTVLSVRSVKWDWVCLASETTKHVL